MKKKILAVVGSPRKKGNSVSLVKEALKAFPEDEFETDIIYLRDYKYSSCIGCEKCSESHSCTIKDDMQKIYPQLEDADAVIFASPVYNYNITAWMKAFIDRLYCYYEFSDDRRSWKCRLGKDRPVMLIVVGEQEDIKSMGITMEAMRLPIEALEFDIVGELLVYGKFAAGVVKDDKKEMQRAQEMGIRLRDSI